MTENRSKRGGIHSSHSPLLRALSFAALGSFALSPNLPGFYDLAGGEVILDTRVSVGYDSNLFGRSGGDDDFFASLAPTLSWLRSAGLSNLNITAGLDITRYEENTGENFEDYFGRFSAGFPIPAESDLSGAVNMGYARRTRLDQYRFDRITTDTFDAGVNGAYQLRPATRLTSSYAHSNAETGDFTTVTDSGKFGVGFSEILRHLDLSFSYRIRHSRLERITGTRDSLDHAFFADLSGPLLPEVWLPRVSTSFSLGYDNTLPTAEENRTRRRIVGSAGATWEAREYTTVGLSVRRDLNLTPDQRNVETTRLNLNVDQRIGEKINGNAFAGYSWNHFSGEDRRSETLRAGSGLSYSMNRNWSAGGNYVYTSNITSEPLRDFDRHLVTLFTSYVF